MDDKLTFRRYHDGDETYQRWSEDIFEATMRRYVYTDYDRCIGRHICAGVFPTGFINMGMGAS